MSRIRIDPGLALGIPVVCLLLLWEANDGGYAATSWYPGGLFVLALLVALAVTRFELLVLPRWSALAIAFLAAFTAWSFLSITWADVQGDAWDGANRTLLYLLAFVLFVSVPWRPAGALVVFGLFALGVAALGLGVLVHASLGDVQRAFLDRRFYQPLGYENANACLFLLAFWPALFLAARRTVPIVARGLFLGAAGVLVELAILVQSRGALFAFPFVLALYFAFVPGRVRSLLPALLVAAVVAASARPLLDVYKLSDQGRVRLATVVSARNSILVSLAVLVVIGLALGFADRRLTMTAETARRATLAAGTAALSALAVACVVVLVITGDPFSRASTAWRDFKAGSQSSDAQSSRFLTLGSNRYDIWRIAWNEFTASPLHGVGVDNFGVDQIRERHTNEEPRYPHSLELRILAQTGLVGALLFAGFLLSAGAAAWKARSRQGPGARAVAAALLITFAYWFVHGSVDWFWEFPGLAVPALAALAIPGRLRDPSADEGEVRIGAGRRATALVALTLASAVTVVSFLPPWLAARYVDEATSSWRAHPEAAYTALARARRLNFLSEIPDVFAGAIAARRGEWARARSAFARALERNPDNWYAQLELAVLDAMAHRREAALARLLVAERLNPREPLIDLALERVRKGEPITVAELDSVFRQRVENRFDLTL